MEHRGIPPDITYLKSILPDVYQFVIWIMKSIFKSELDIYKILAVELETVYQDFFKWKESKLGEIMLRELRNEEGYEKRNEGLLFFQSLTLLQVMKSDKYITSTNIKNTSVLTEIKVI